MYFLLEYLMVRRFDVTDETIFITRWFKTKYFRLDQLESIEFNLNPYAAHGGRKARFGLYFHLFPTSKFFFWKPKHPAFATWRPNLEADLDLLTSDFLQELKEFADLNAIIFKGYGEAYSALVRREDRV